MHILLTDILSCPRCGPEFGLILVAERIERRRVLDGLLGCSNCRERYGITGGVADLRRPPAGRAAPLGGEAEGSREDAFRLAALMGVSEGPGFSLVAGPATRLAAWLPELIERLEVVAVEPGPGTWPEQPGVSRMAAGTRLPLFGRTMRAVALTGDAAATLLDEGARVLASAGRLVLSPAPDDAAGRVEAAGLELLARQEGVVVAARP